MDMSRASRLRSRQRDGPGTGLVRMLRLSFLGGTYKLLTAPVKNIGVALHGAQSRALVGLGHDETEWGKSTELVG
jgi:hypothetical protein